MEINFATCQIISRFLLPVCLLFVAIIRQNVFSALYLILFFLSPFFPSPKVIRNQSNLYIKTVFTITTLICTSHVLFQSVLLFNADFKDELENDCSRMATMLRIFGLHNLTHLSVMNITRLFICDFIVLIIVLVFFIVTQQIYNSATQRLDERLVSNDEIGGERRPESPPTSGPDAHGEFYNRFRFPIELHSSKSIQHKVKMWKLVQITKYFFEVLFLVLLGSCAILNPSVLSASYFLILLFILTWFGFNKRFTSFYVYLRILVCFLAVCHLSLLFAYQLLEVNQEIRSGEFLARLFGLTQYVEVSCVPFYNENIRVLNWNVYIHPILLCTLYLTTIYLIKYHFMAKRQKALYKSQRTGYNDLDNLDHSEQEQTLNPADHSSEQEESKQIVFNEDGTPKKATQNHLRLNTTKKFKTSTPPSSPSVFNTLQLIDFERLTKFNIVLNLLNLIKKGSYVGTLIIMMTWSITYHSWMGFVLLIASCIIWMMPNSRQVCLKSSVFLIIYAIFLLISSYVFSLNLTESELPTKVNGVNLDEIGFKKDAYDLAYKSLFIKLLYTLVFYITLRQYMEENYISHHMDDMHFQRTGDHPDNTSFTEERHMSLAANYTFNDIDPMLNKTIKVVREFLSKYWIIIVTLLLMVMSLSGKSVVLYRIVYMSLFLAFVLVFQISYRLWRKFIYLFWLIVIVYSMTVLVAIYTYQFKDFKNYWQNYLGISLEWQKSIGLEEYKHDDPLLLFNELLTPTFFIIITIIQVHFFHQEFLQLSNLHQSSCIDVQISDSTQMTVADTSFSRSGEMRKSSSANSSNITDELNTEIKIDIESDQEKGDKTDDEAAKGRQSAVNGGKDAEKGKDEKASKKLNKEFLVEEITSESPLFGITAESAFEIIWPTILHGYELFWRALELHMMKIVFICAIIAALDDVSLINFVLIILIAIGLPMKQFERIICHTLVLWTACLILLKMFYQLSVVQSVKWQSNCDTIYGLPNNTKLYPPFDKTTDNRVYIGFRRADNVLSIILKDLIIVLILTFNTLVYIRQTIVRFKRKEVPPKSDCLFIGVYRKDADKNVTQLIKFMINYWFYKFGLEFIAVFLVFAIAARRDFIALVFALFLFPITLMKRSTVKRIWPLIVIMQTFMLPIQYLLILGLPIGLCTEYPWSAYYLSPTIRQWLFLSDYQFPPDQTFLYYDFFVLMFFCRQLYVFTKENQISHPTSGRASVQLDAGNGGSNDELKDESYSTTDPNIEDYFKTSNKTILDVFKTSFFSCFYWITLAVLFITANNRQNLFGLGYIVGCFVFLWNGNDFYLKNRRKVFRNWKYLILYTWCVIVLKTILALIGCEHAEVLFKDFCALARLFGIDCASKLVCSSKSPNIVETKWIDNKDCLTTPNFGNTLAWDAICLLFLVIQKRIFGSYYFNYLVIEVKAQQRLASRGAELIHEIQSKEYKEEKEEERELMGKIKAKMDIIRANQRKTIDSVDYKPKHHYQACRSGDYYMTDNPEGEILDSEEKEKKSLIPDPIGDELRRYAETRGFSAFCSNFVKGSFFDASPEQTLHVGDSSKDSAIVSIDRSEHKSSFSQRTRTQLPSTADQPQPSTSTGGTDPLASGSKKDGKDDGGKSDSGSQKDEEKPADGKRTESFLFKIKKWLKIIKYFFMSCLISATVKLNEVSRDYRYVSRRLAVEKKALKCIIHLKGTIEAQKQLAEKISNARVPELRTKTKKQRKTEVGDYEQEQSKKRNSQEEDLSELADYYLDYNVLMRFIFAIGYAIVSQSEILCYVFVIFNQMKNASLISLPLPLMVFLWGCLSLPRPSKTFWISLITYTEAIVVAKYISQFKVWEWINFNMVPPDWPNVSKTSEPTNNSSYDLFLLLVLFFHRFMLKSLGLWDQDLVVTRFDEESDRLSTKSDHDYIVNKDRVNNLALENQELRKRKAPPNNQKQPTDETKASAVSLNKLDQAPEQFADKPEQTYYFAFFHPLHDFFNQLFKLSEYRIAKDFYAFMFLCDFFNFFIVVFGYGSFGSPNTETTDITTYIREDRIPILFFVMVFIQFVIIIIDRALYLRKNIFYRLVFHVSLVVLIHLWLFFVIPLYTQRNFTANSAPMFWYVFKTIYLILSANQIKSGYPTRILGNCFTKKYHLLNLYLFKVYMAIPFLYDLRLIMDWIWTESSLDLNEWATMEDIFKQLFERKCEINYNDKFPYPRGEGRRRRNKFLMGGFYFMIVIIAIWFPLTLFAFGSQVGTPTKPLEVSISLEFTGYQPIFKMSANQNALLNLTNPDWEALQKKFPDSSSQFLASYSYEDVVVASINGNSFATWDISPPNKNELIESLLDKDTTVTVKLTWRIKRKKKSQSMDVEIFNEHEVALVANETYAKIRQDLATMLNNNSGWAEIPLLFPNCILIPSKDEPRVITALQFENPQNKSLRSEYRNINISLNRDQESYWWTVSEVGEPYEFMGINTTDQVAFLLFNDRVFPDSLQFISGYGIIGLYSTFVFVVSRLIRGFFDDLSFKVVYTHLPCVRKVLQLCLDIYLVRESGEFELEEDLYAKLIFLYRSPETLIGWTRVDRNNDAKKANESDARA